ncbi:erythropoietin [Sapajus apella]|uniref:Erythropoietin n=1 Tax=Sapajus apella TaxID=9515 RepID=A0A6J3FYA6_SAPAP|nr:erythropoietin [Sapajus apella]
MQITAPTPSRSRRVPGPPRPLAALRRTEPCSRSRTGATAPALLQPRAHWTAALSSRPVGLALPRRASRDEGSRAGAIGREVAGFKDQRLVKDPGGGKGVGQPPRAKCPAWLWLLLSLLWLPLGLPVLGAPLHLICDSGVLERYVLEGKEAENVTMGCAEGCSLNENITVPDTKVNFYAWKKMEFEQQAVDVWQGLTLLSEAVLRGRALLANSSQPREPLQLHMDRAVSGLRSLTTLLRALGAQKEATSPPDTAPSAVPLQTITADTFRKLFQVYSNFIRGKLKLYTGEACRTGDR